MKTLRIFKTSFNTNLSLFSVSFLCCALQLAPINLLPVQAQPSTAAKDDKASVNSVKQQIQVLVKESKFAEANSLFVNNVPDMKTEFLKA